MKERTTKIRTRGPKTSKLRIREHRARTIVIRMQKVILAMMLLIGINASGLAKATSGENTCPKVKVEFLRGSGSPLVGDENYDALVAGINKYTADIDFFEGNKVLEVDNLAYPAQGIGADNIFALLGAAFGAGDAYEFGASVDTGVAMLENEVNHGRCRNTKYVLVGYSQGAMAVSKAIHSLNPEKIIYAAAVGDPKIYLPEGEGLIPAACFGDNLSEYRAYVPDCRAYEGLLGSYRPYQPLGYAGKFGTWCNKYDLFCSSYLSLNSHVSYTSDNIYDDVAKTVVNKILDYYDVELRVGLKNTVLMIDGSESMERMIEQYKREAIRLANKTFDTGGKVAVYIFRDYDDGEGNRLIKICDFDGCTVETVKLGVNDIVVHNFNNYDWPESVLASSESIMRELKWDDGATKSLVVLTDASFHSPDKNGVTYDDVVRLSREIDPVNFYVVTNERAASYYGNLVADTDGKLAIIGEDEIELTDYVANRYDSLPKVEYNDDEEVLPSVQIVNAEVADDAATITLSGDYESVLVLVNDAVIGRSSENEIVVNELDRAIKNTVRVVALSETRRGGADELEISVAEEEKPDTLATNGENTERASGRGADIIIPKTPDTGVVKSGWTRTISRAGR